jgi:hypothetical protein
LRSSACVFSENENRLGASDPRWKKRAKGSKGKKKARLWRRGYWGRGIQRRILARSRQRANWGKGGRRKGNTKEIVERERVDRNRYDGKAVFTGQANSLSVRAVQSGGAGKCFQATYQLSNAMPSSMFR